MSFYRATSLRFRLMALVVVAVLPVFGLLLFHAYADKERKIHAIEEDAVRMTELAAGSVGKIIEASHQLLMFMAYTEPVRSGRAAEATVLFGQMLGGSWENLGLVRSDGAVLASALSVSGPVQLKDRSWFARMQQSRGFAIGEFQVGRITGKPTLNVAFPLPDQPKEAPMDAVFAALNTMYSSVSARTREIATLRALGFGSGAVVVSVMIESLALALVGGVTGALVAYFAFNGIEAATMNWQSFSQVTFAFAVTPDLLAQGIVWAVLIGLIGGLFPAIQGARLPIAMALREL